MTRVKKITLKFDEDRFEATCECGDKMSIVGPAPTVEALRRIWFRRHQGDGHGPARAKRKEIKAEGTEK
jgi:hypothetical protein